MGGAMRRYLQISGLVIALMLAWAAEAVGLGRLSVLSALGQPLRAEIELLSVERDEINTLSARLASAEAFRQARMERAEILSSLRFEIEQRAGGQPVIKITSVVPINDPFLDLLVELSWNTGRIIREYTLLLDPPAEARLNGDSSQAPALVTPSDESHVPTQHAASAVAEDTPAQPAVPARYGPVKAGETLQAIAAKTRPADVTLEQMMVGIYYLNPAAFQGHNMNRLKRGTVLDLPDRESAMRVDPARASREVRAHASEWIAYRRRLAEGVATTSARYTPQTGVGRLTKAPKGSLAVPVAPAEDVLRLSKGEPSSAEALERIQSLEEELAAKERALKEAQERVAELERTVKDLQRLLELKAAEANEPAAPEVLAAPAQAKPETVAPAAGAATKVTPPAAVTAPLPIPESEPGWLSTFSTNPFYIGGLAAAVLLSFLLGMIAGNRRRKASTNLEDRAMSGDGFRKEAVSLAPAEAEGTPTSGSVSLTDLSHLDSEAIDAEEVDPIVEAEVLMAYGRNSQAEEILKEALSREPNRHEIALKLLEIYAARPDTVAFEALARELYANLGGQPTEVWLKAAELGRSIDPDNPLYRVTSATAAAAGMAATAAAAAAAATTAIAEPAPTAEPLKLTGRSEPVASSQLGLEQPPPATEKSTALDFDLGSGSSPGVAAEPTLSDQLTPESVPSAPSTAAAPPALDSHEASESTSLDFDLEAPSADTVSAPDPSDITVAEVEELELPAATTAETTSTHERLSHDMAINPSPTEAKLDVPEIDFSGIDLELKDVLTPEDSSATETAPSGSELEGVERPANAEAVTEAPTGIDPEVWEENNTKLDLARAYLEMGDKEGAREILQEVLADGDNRQKDEANKLLAEAA